MNSWNEKPCTLGFKCNCWRPIRFTAGRVVVTYKSFNCDEQSVCSLSHLERWAWLLCHILKTPNSLSLSFSLSLFLIRSPTSQVPADDLSLRAARGYTRHALIRTGLFHVRIKIFLLCRLLKALSRLLSGSKHHLHLRQDKNITFMNDSHRGDGINLNAVYCGLNIMSWGWISLQVRNRN